MAIQIGSNLMTEMSVTVKWTMMRYYITHFFAQAFSMMSITCFLNYLVVQKPWYKYLRDFQFLVYKNNMGLTRVLFILFSQMFEEYCPTLTWFRK